MRWPMPMDNEALERLERLRQQHRSQMIEDIEAKLGRPMVDTEIEFMNTFMEKLGDEFVKYVCKQHGLEGGEE